MDANLTSEFSRLSASEKEIRDKNLKKKTETEVPRITEYPRPVLTNTHLVVLAMKNSPMDFVTIGDVYKFIEGRDSGLTCKFAFLDGKDLKFCLSLGGFVSIYITISTFTSVRPNGVRPSRPVPLPSFIIFRVLDAQSDCC